MGRIGRCLSSGILVVFALGCARQDRFTLISDRPLALGPETAQFKGRYQGQDGRWGNWVWFWGGGTIPSLEKATEAALTAGGGNLLLNAEIYEKITFYPWLLTYWNFRVEGDVYHVPGVR